MIRLHVVVFFKRLTLGLHRGGGVCSHTAGGLFGDVFGGVCVAGLVKSGELLFKKSLATYFLDTFDSKHVVDLG